MQAVCTQRRTGFTLVEILMVVTVVAILGAIAFGVSRRVIEGARRAQDASQLRRIGVAVLDYTNEHGGRFPLTSHSLNHSQQNQAWIYTLEPYLADLDEALISPADSRGPQRQEEGGTSYILNSYLVVPQVDSFGRPLDGPSYTRLQNVPHPSQTPIAFPINFSRGTGTANDHTHSDNWTSWQRVRHDIQPDAFGGGSDDGLKGDANYLFVDGRVENIEARELHEQITSGHNFADPASHAP